MSISSARTFIEKSGCGLIVGIILAVVITASLFSAPNCRGGMQSNTEAAKPIPVAHVGSQVVSLQSVDNRYRQAASMFLTVEGGAPPLSEAQVYADALSAEIRSAAQREIARKRGITASKDQILQELGKQLDGQLAQVRIQLMQSGQLKAGATETEAQAAIAKAIGTDVDTWKKNQLKAIEDAYEDPTKRPDLESPVLGAALIASVSSTIQLSDDELKRIRQTVVTKRIVFDPLKHKGEDLTQKAEKVRREITAGLSFEAAMEKYSDDPAPPKKKKGEATVSLERGTIEFDKKLSPIKALQPGQMTEVFQLGTGETAIYKVISIDTKVPDSFENQKADLKKSEVQRRAFRQVQDEIEAMEKSDAVKWDSEGFRVLYQWAKIQNDEDLAKDETKRLAALKRLAEEAKTTANEADEIGNRPAALTWFVSFDAVYKKASADEKAKLGESWLEAANAVLESIQSVELRLEIAKISLELKRIDEAGVSLKNASEDNTGAGEEAFRRYKEIDALAKKLAAAGAKKEVVDGIQSAQNQWKDEAFEALKSDAEFNEDYSDTGRAKWAEINRKIESYRTLGVIDATQAAEVEKLQAKWKTEKEKADAEAAAERKKQADEAKKAAEEAKKTAATNPPATKPSAPSSTDLGKATGKAGG